MDEIDRFTDRLTLSRTAVDRDAATRSSGDLDALAAAPTTRFVVLRGGKALLAAPVADDETPRLALLAEPPAGESSRLYLGRTLTADEDADAGAAIFGVLLTEDVDLAGEWGDLRMLGARLGDRDAGLFTEALALANWHRSHRFSPRTGVPTVTSQAGWVRHPADSPDETSGEHVFPRTDPAVIVGVVDPDDRILLGSAVAWPDGRYSLLAGFVEPGESLEAAVRREVAEESGVRVSTVTYMGSQPWPFPASLMVGFLAAADGGQTPTADGIELRDVAWFSRAQIGAGAVKLPGRSSIARAIIEHWYGGELDSDW